MLKIIKLFIVVSVFSIFSAISASPGLAGEEDVLGAPCVVDGFLRAHEQTMQANANAGDVESLMQFVAVDLVYEHPRVGIKIEGAEAYRAGVTAFLGGTDEGRYQVIDYLVNGDTVAITFNRIFKTLTDGQWQEKAIQQLVIFEVKDGKIARIIDYW